MGDEEKSLYAVCLRIYTYDTCACTVKAALIVSLEGEKKWRYKACDSLSDVFCLHLHYSVINKSEGLISVMLYQMRFDHIYFTLS